jgi:hypothetical protein
MSDEKNKRLLKKIFGYYPVFDPKTMKKIPPKTPEEKIDSHFSYLDVKRRNSIKAKISDPEKVLERAKNLEKMIGIRVKHTGACNEYEAVEWFRIINDCLFVYISNDTILDSIILLSKIPSLPFSDADVIFDEILNDDYLVMDMSVAKFEKLIQYLNKDQRDLLVIYLDAMIKAYYEYYNSLNN